MFSIKKISTIALLVFIASCNSSDNSSKYFYQGARMSDLFVLPLISPYKLISSSTDPPWLITFGKPALVRENLRYNQFPISEINVEKGVIFGYSDTFSFYVVVIADKKIELVWRNKSEWSKYLEQIGIQHDKLYDPTKLYKKYREDYTTLPWGPYKK